MKSSLLVRLLNRFNLLEDRIFILCKRLNGIIWKIPIINKVGFNYAYSNSEEWLYSLYNKIHDLKSIDSFIDVGVNLGQTLIKVKSISKAIPYYGFEPNSLCVYYVHYLRILNQLPKTTLFGVGLGNTVSVLPLHGFSDEDSRASLFYNNIYSDGSSVLSVIPVFTLDHFMDQIIISNFSILKIDVEGFEYEVLDGAFDLISKNMPILIFEVLPHHNDEILKSKQIRIMEFLAKNQYKIYKISKDTLKLELINNLTKNISNLDMTDYCAFSEIHSTTYQALINV